MWFSRFILLLTLAGFGEAVAQQITVNHQPGRLDIWPAGSCSIRITLKPLSFQPDFPESPAVTERNYGASVIGLTDIKQPLHRLVGNFNVTVSPNLFVSVIAPGTRFTSEPKVSDPVNKRNISEHAPLTVLWPDTYEGKGGHKNASGEYGLHCCPFIFVLPFTGPDHASIVWFSK